MGWQVQPEAAASSPRGHSRNLIFPHHLGAAGSVAAARVGGGLNGLGGCGIGWRDRVDASTRLVINWLHNYVAGSTTSWERRPTSAVRAIVGFQE